VGKKLLFQERTERFRKTHGLIEGPMFEVAELLARLTADEGAGYGRCCQRLPPAVLSAILSSLALFAF
jgi:hypothetical protein